MADEPRKATRQQRLLWLPILVILYPIVYTIVVSAMQWGDGAVYATIQRPDAQHTNCVRDTMYMRYHHWELLTQVRDDVMRRGKRATIGLIGLNKCQECHTSKENFCNHCHNAVNLYPSCWKCHYYP